MSYLLKIVSLAALVVAIQSTAACADYPERVSGAPTVTQTSTSIATVTETVSATSTTVPEPDNRQVYAVGDEPGNGVVKVCDDHSGIATGDTSCGFAQNIGKAYLENPRRSVSAYSDARKKPFELTCEAGYAISYEDVEIDAIRCYGGDNAVVIVFNGV